MKLKTLFLGAGAVAVVGLGAFHCNNLYQEKSHIDNYLADFSMSGVDITYNPINPFKLNNSVVTLEDVVITTKDFRLESSYMIIDDSFFEKGALSLHEAEIVSDSFTGNAARIDVSDFTWGMGSKNINLSYVNMSLSAKTFDIEQGSGTINLEQLDSELRVKYSSLSNGGEMINADIEFKIDSSPTMEIDISDTINNGAIKKAKLEIRNVGFYQTLRAKSPDADKWLVGISSDMKSHHYPKARRLGKDLSSFVDEQGSIAISIEPKEAIKLEQFKYLKNADSLKMIDFMDLNIATQK